MARIEEFIIHFGAQGVVRQEGDTLLLRQGSCAALVSFLPEIDRLIVKQVMTDLGARKRGEGTRLMTRIAGAADSVGWDTALVTVPIGGAKDETREERRAAFAALERFYDRMGYGPGPLRVREKNTPPSSHAIRAFAEDIAAAAQAEIDDWEQDEDGYDEVLGAGGACGLVAERISQILVDLGADTARGETEFDGGHEFVHARLLDGVFRIDIPARVYETGGGYVWTKRQDARITPDDVTIEKIDGPMSEAEFGRAYGEDLEAIEYA